MAKKTSLKDLSLHLGLSQTTVSRGLADYPEVSDSTKARIRQAAADLNYAPSNSAKKLAIGKSLTIGHIIALRDHMTLNPFYADFIAGAGECYAQYGYDMLISMVDPAKELSTYRDLANSQKVDGFVISEPTPNDERISLLQSLDIPFIVHGRSHAHQQDTSHYHWLDVNNKKGFENATRYLLEQGHRDIALVNGLETMNFALRRRQGFEAAMAAFDAPIREEWLFSEDMVEHRGYQVAQTLLAQKHKPTAIICSSVLLALGIHRAMSVQGLKLGEDISVICWDDCLSAFSDRSDVPQFTAMRSSIFEAGSEIAALLLSQIQQRQTGFQSKLMEASLVIGQSTGRGPFYGTS